VSIHARELARRQPNGRPVKVYDVRLRGYDGQPYKRTFPNRDEAKAWQADEISKLAAGTWSDTRRGRRLSVEAVAGMWLDKDPIKRKSSKARDMSTLRTYVFPVIGKRAVGSVTRSDIQSLGSGWTQTHSASSVVRMFATLRGLFSLAESDELVGRSPCTRIKVPKPELVARPLLDAEQLSALSGELGSDMGTFMWLGVVLGLRWAEVAALTVGSIDTLRGRLTVSGQIARDGSRQLPKSSAGLRTLSVPAWLAEELAGVMARRGLNASTPQELLFVSSDGSPLHYSNWRLRTWAPACARAGVAGLKFHDLRSMAATALIASGADVKTTQRRMGHSSPQLTLALYARATERADVAAAEAVGSYFRPTRGANSSEEERHHPGGGPSARDV
jgi:integrase